MEQPLDEPQARPSAFSYASTREYFDSAREALDMSTTSFEKPSGHKLGHVVQSIHSLLRSDSRDIGSGRSSTDLKRRGRSCELPRGPCSGCTMLPTIASRQNSAPDSLPAISRQNSGSIPSPSRPRPGFLTPPKAAATPGCPVIPGLTWKKHIGSGSFARVYRGEWQSMQVAVKVLSSKANEANMSSDLFESLLSANMHHPNVETYEVLTVEVPEHERYPTKSGRRGSLHEVLTRSGSASSLAEAAAQASKLDSIASFFANQRDQQELAGSSPLESIGTLEFAACAVANEDIQELVAKDASLAREGIPGNHGTSIEALSPKTLRDILDRAGMFSGSRTSSQPLPLSPFDSAISRAFTAGSQDLDARAGHAAGPGSEPRVAATAAISTGAAAAAAAGPAAERSGCRGTSATAGGDSPGGGGSCGGPSASALIGFAQHAADAAAALPAARGFRGGCGEGIDMDSWRPVSCCSASCACCGSRAVPCDCAPIRAAARPPPGHAPGLRPGFEGRSCSITSQYNMQSLQSLSSGETTRASSWLSVQTANPGSLPCTSRSKLISSMANEGTLEGSRMGSLLDGGSRGGSLLEGCCMGFLASSLPNVIAPIPEQPPFFPPRPPLASKGATPLEGSRMGSLIEGYHGGSLASSLPNRIAPIPEQPPLSPPRPPLPAPSTGGGCLGGTVPPAKDRPGLAERPGAARQQQRLPPTLPLSVFATAGNDGGRTTAGGAAGGNPHPGGSPIPMPLRPPPQQPPQVPLLMELGDQRSLHTAISKGRLSGNLEAILLCAMDIAAGMAYLHSMGIIHADLKPANVLLMSAPVTADDPRGFICKIADFGMSQVVTGESSHVPVADTHGSLPYVAPEVLLDGEVAKRADVYSFAMLLLEMWSGKVAYSEDNYHAVLFLIFSGRRPNIPDNIPPEYCALMKECWSDEPKQRPTFATAHARLCAQLAMLRGELTPEQAARLASLGNRGVHSTA